MSLLPAWVFVNGYRSVPFIGGKAHPSISESKQGRIGAPHVGVAHSPIASKRPSTNVWKEAQVTAIASLVERSGELKRELLEFSRRPRFDRDRREVLRDHFPERSFVTSRNW